MHEWMQNHEALLWWLTLLSFAMLLAGVVAGPLWAIRIPADYFTRERHEARVAPAARHKAISVARNLLGLLLVLAGLLMLILPGQGVLAILIGVMLTDFPGKYRVARWIIGRPAVHTSINWLRRRAGKQPLVIS